MPTINHFPNLVAAFLAEWVNRPPVLQPYNLIHDGNRYWYVTGTGDGDLARWECRPFPGCSALVTTTQFEVHALHRRRGVGEALRGVQHKAYKRAGFKGEIATVRTDNAAMNAFMSGRVIEEFPSDFGGTFKLWLTRFDEPVVQTAPAPTPPPAPKCGHYRTGHLAWCNLPVNHEGLHSNGFSYWPRRDTPPPAPPPPPTLPEAPNTTSTKKLYSHWPDDETP